MEIYVPIEGLRKQCNIDFNDDDDILYELLEVAQDHVESYLERPLSDFVRDGRLYSPVRHAIKTLVSTLYANRENIAFAKPECLGIIEGLLARHKNVLIKKNI